MKSLYKMWEDVEADECGAKCQNIEEEALKRFKEAENAYREYIHKSIHVGNGILDQIKPTESITLKVEDLYESMRPDFWWTLDRLFEDRVDLHDRIKRYKESYYGRTIKNKQDNRDS